MKLPSTLFTFIGWLCASLTYATNTPIAPADLVFAEVDGIVAVEAEHFIKQDQTEVRAWHLISTANAPVIPPYHGATKDDDDYTAAIIGGIIGGIAVVGIIMAGIYEPLRPFGIVMIGIGGFLSFNYYGNRKRKSDDKK